MDTIVIRREAAHEQRAVEELVRDAFWNVYRPGALEHFVLHRLRTEACCVRELDLVMYRAQELIGQVVFVRASVFALRYHGLPPGADASFFLAKALRPGYLDGRAGEYTPPAPYFVCEREPEAFEAYEATFPPRAKLRLSGQLF